MPPRAYSSPARAAAAAEKRARVLEVGSRLLREGPGVSSFSMEAVARAAGLTRLTVYNQFGSRRGLLEAIFDEIAREGGLGRIPRAMAMADPRAALMRLVEIFCDYWSGDAALTRLADAAVLDAEFAQAIAERNERRRTAISALVKRMPEAGTRSPAERREVVDVAFALTSLPMFRTLAVGRPTSAVCRIIKTACAAALDGLATAPPDR